MPSLEFVTFLLAMLGYAGLTATVWLSVKGAVPVGFWRLTALVIVVHVAMVWTIRYEWQFAEATRNGYAGFLMFHSALLLIVASVFLRPQSARLLIRTAFVIVTMGALGAVFIYDVVAIYRIPVILCAVLGSLGLARVFLHVRGLRLGSS